MVFTSFDPRAIIRNVICSKFDIDNDGKDEYYILVGSIKVPIYFGESSKANTLPNMPFILLDLMTSSAEPQDVMAATRKHEAIIDVSIYFANTDDIDVDTFGKLISDVFVNLIRTNQCTFAKDFFANVRNEGRVITESRGRQVVFQRHMELYTIYYDNIP
jgi:hypothetical protein